MFSSKYEHEMKLPKITKAAVGTRKAMMDHHQISILVCFLRRPRKKNIKESFTLITAVPNKVVVASCNFSLWIIWETKSAGGARRPASTYSSK